VGDRLLWRCRRGMRELDTVVEGYYLRCYAQLDTSGKATFETLLEEADPDIFAWLTRKQPVPRNYLPLIERMRTLASEA
jgi:antitoxin CptB